MTTTPRGATVRRRLATGTAAGVVALLVAAGCTAPRDDTDTDAAPSPSVTPSPSPSPTEPTLTLQDVSVSGTARSNRGGILLCGDRLVAVPPAAGIENNAFAVFDENSGEGEITHVELPADSPLEENARWLLVMQCVDNPEVTEDGPVLSFAYLEMPLPEEGGVGVRGAYSLDGQLLWMRDDIAVPSELVGGLLVLGAAPDQPALVVDAVTGETLREFSSALSSRIVLTHNRMVVRGTDGGPVLTNISGDRVRRLGASDAFFADEDLIFGVGFRDVVAMRARTGKQLWTFPIRFDPLSVPNADAEPGVTVLVDRNYVAHGIDSSTGEQLWRFPTEVENPRVTMAAGMVLIDHREEADYQVLLDARSGARLPEPAEAIVDLKNVGALMFIEGVATIVPPEDLRDPATTPTADDEEGQPG